MGLHLPQAPATYKAHSFLDFLNGRRSMSLCGNGFHLGLDRRTHSSSVCGSGNCDTLMRRGLGLFRSSSGALLGFPSLLLLLLALDVVLGFMPSPEWTEAVEEPDILEEVGIQPQARWNQEEGEDEKYETEDGHGEKQADQPHRSHGEIPHTLPQDERPQREENGGKDCKENNTGPDLGLPLWPFVQPHVMHHRVKVLLLFDLDLPQPFDSFLLFWFGVVVSFMGVFLGHSEGEHG